MSETSGLIRNRIDKFIRVSDDWQNYFEGDTVKVSLFLYYIPNNECSFVRVMVWNNGDFGLEMDYESSDYDGLLSKFEEWKTEIYDKAVDGIDKEWFYQNGLHIVEDNDDSEDEYGE